MNQTINKETIENLIVKNMDKRTEIKKILYDLLSNEWSPRDNKHTVNSLLEGYANKIIRIMGENDGE